MNYQSPGFLYLCGCHELTVFHALQHHHLKPKLYFESKTYKVFLHCCTFPFDFVKDLISSSAIITETRDQNINKS